MGYYSSIMKCAGQWSNKSGVVCPWATTFYMDFKTNLLQCSAGYGVKSTSVRLPINRCDENKGSSQSYCWQWSYGCSIVLWSRYWTRNLASWVNNNNIIINTFVKRRNAVASEAPLASTDHPSRVDKLVSVQLTVGFYCWMIAKVVCCVVCGVCSL